MGKDLFIAEKPSVAAEFAKALRMNAPRRDGYMENDSYVVTWCVGHLVTMSYPERYDGALKKWSLSTLPFIPDKFLYEVIPGVKKQFDIVSGLLNRKDVSRIYVCTDSGREGEYIYRLVDMMAGVSGKEKLRVWIDSQTEEEILRGIREAKPEASYDNLSASAFLRAKEDYLMGINFSRVLTLKYGNLLAGATGQPYAVISAGRVMTCVLGMVVRREREIRAFVKTPFYRVVADAEGKGAAFSAEWRAGEGSRYEASPLLYKENGFQKREDAEALIRALPETGVLESLTKKKESKHPPLLFNLAELQNECAKLYKISPDNTLKIAQELYEKKLTTYPRTDARVLSTAVAKEIGKNLAGLRNVPQVSAFAETILSEKRYEGLGKTRYVNDKAITDHYAIIPTGQGLSALNSLSPVARQVYERICRRFLSIFYPPAEYRKLSLTVLVEAAGQDAAGKHWSSRERFYTNLKALLQAGYLEVMGKGTEAGGESAGKESGETGEQEASAVSGDQAKTIAEKLKKGDIIDLKGFSVKEGETSPPKRYTSGSMILAMENAGQLIEDEELRAQIKGSGIGTSATRAEILKKLVNIKYLQLNQKTQVITPTMFGEMVNDVVQASIPKLLNPELTASWEKGLSYVAEGSVSEGEYMEKLDAFVRKRTEAVKAVRNESQMRSYLARIPAFYREQETAKRSSERKKSIRKDEAAGRQEEQKA